MKNLKMRLESFASRLEFNERRARALESVVAYKPAAKSGQPGRTRDAVRMAGATTAAVKTLVARTDAVRTRAARAAMTDAVRKDAGRSRGDHSRSRSRSRLRRQRRHGSYRRRPGSSRGRTCHAGRASRRRARGPWTEESASPAASWTTRQRFRSRNHGRRPAWRGRIVARCRPGQRRCRGVRGRACRAGRLGSRSGAELRHAVRSAGALRARVRRAGPPFGTRGQGSGADACGVVRRRSVRAGPDQEPSPADPPATPEQ